MNTLTQEDNFNLAVTAINNAGVAFILTSDATCGCCATSELFNLKGDEEYAYSIFNQDEKIESSIEWKHGSLYFVYTEAVAPDICIDCEFDEETGDVEHTYDSECEQGYPVEVEREYEWNTIYLSFSSVKAGEVCAASFKAQGFEVDWNGTIGQAVVISVK